MANSSKLTVRPWNARLRCPVDVLTLGNWIHRVDADRSRGHPRTSSTGTQEFCRQYRSSTMDTLPHEQSDLEGDSLTYWKPVETVELVTYGHSVELLALDIFSILNYRANYCVSYTIVRSVIRNWRNVNIVKHTAKLFAQIARTLWLTCFLIL